MPKIQTIDKNDQSIRGILNNSVYTIQQSIGAALDGLPIGKSNIARKLNGDLFEHFIRLVIQETGIDCQSNTIQIPIIVDGKTDFFMKYQHDLIIKKDDEIAIIGSIKTSSKDRIDKIFIDKFLYSKLTEKTTPHIAIFFHDVQRKNPRKENEMGLIPRFYRDILKDTQLNSIHWTAFIIVTFVPICRQKTF
ncbi:MAG: hypothetical protein LBJ67_04165 [Planctomycetaceae bacterium]|nr:hypothetical protein [Planctomycetaceae bacterium]